MAFLQRQLSAHAYSLLHNLGVLEEERKLCHCSCWQAHAGMMHPWLALKTFCAFTCAVASDFACAAAFQRCSSAPTTPPQIVEMAREHIISACKQHRACLEQRHRDQARECPPSSLGPCPGDVAAQRNPKPPKRLSGHMCKERQRRRPFFDPACSRAGVVACRLAWRHPMPHAALVSHDTLLSDTFFFRMCTSASSTRISRS